MLPPATNVQNVQVGTNSLVLDRHTACHVLLALANTERVKQRVSTVVSVACQISRHLLLTNASNVALVQCKTKGNKVFASLVGLAIFKKVLQVLVVLAAKGGSLLHFLVRHRASFA